MNTHEARALGNDLARLIDAGEYDSACVLLAPVLASDVLCRRTPFRLLDVIGAAAAAAASPAALDPFLEQLATGRTMGGWVVAGAALRRRFDDDPAWAFDRCRAFICLAGVWYAADSLAERLPGPALVAGFGRKPVERSVWENMPIRLSTTALALLAPWRGDPDRWLRRAAGVAVHFWAKRARGDPSLAPRAAALLDFLAPLFAERDLDAAKGVGWGLKTLGRYYPTQSAAWLERQLVVSDGSPRAVVLRKALTYLPPDLRRRLLES